MKNIIVLNKKEGETPLEALENFRKKNPIYSKVPMTYAGRLDPMAKGVLLILAGKEIKNKEKYLSLEKEYVFEVLFGFETDTFDILGKVTKSYELKINNYRLEKDIKNNLKKFLGESVQKYPIYSSKTVRGKPLFAYARGGEEIEIPERKIFIKKIKLENIKGKQNKNLLTNIEKRIKKVKGDFRQKEILETWKKELKINKKYLIARINIRCSSGTYIRAIANSLGKIIGIPALAFSIERKKIGKYSI